MYEIRENRRRLKDGTEITTYTRDVVICDILEVEAGTTGFMGGDTGHDGRTYFRIKDEGGTDMDIRVTRDRFGDAEGFEVMLGGDCELETMIRALKFITAINTDGIEKQLMELQQDLVKKANSKEAYDEIAEQIFELREQRQQAAMDTVQRDEQINRITDLQDFIKEQKTDLTEFDEALVKRWLKQITV